MKKLEQNLDPSQFLRIHRSRIVNVECLQELCASTNEFVAIFTDGTERKLSRIDRDAVDDFFDGALSFSLPHQRRLVRPSACRVAVCCPPVSRPTGFSSVC